MEKFLLLEIKRLTLLALLMLAGFHAVAQDSITRNSVIVYKFANFKVIVLNQSANDSGLDKNKRPQSPASRNRFVTVREPLLKIFLTTNEEPFPYPVKMISVDKGEEKTGSILLKDLEYRSGLVTANMFSRWTSIESFPTLKNDSSISLIPLMPGELPITKGKYYILFELAVTTYTDRMVSIRNKTNGEELLNLRFNVIDRPVRPVLAFALRGTANQDPVDSLVTRSSNTIAPLHLIEMFNQENAENSTIPDTSHLLNNDSLYKTSELLLYFAKQRSDYPDSSIEYRLSNGTDTDPSWMKTGHKLTISNLISGSHYELQVRYELHPDHVQKHTFYVVPEWYQSKRFKTLVAGLLLLTALTTCLVFYYNHTKKNRRRREQLSLEIRSIRSQLNPHFVFNALSSIQSLINTNEIRSANLYLTTFSTLLRETLRNNEKEMVPVATEIELLDAYLKLEQLRFDFTFQIDVDEAININATEIPNLLIQPLVENAVKHGVSSLSGAGVIVVAFVKKKGDMEILIKDNGNKFTEMPNGSGFGLKLTRSRIDLLNQSLKEQPISLAIERRGGETILSLLLKNWI